MTFNIYNNKESAMKIKPVLLIFITIVAFVFNCGKSYETYTIEIKDGVKYVHNKAPLWGDTLKVELEFVQQIGEFEGEDENLQFYKISTVVKDSKGNIYILDSGNFRVQKFNPQGKYLSTIGRKGLGPGEFGISYDMDIDENDNLYVCDHRNARVQIFSSDGRYYNSIRTDYLMAKLRLLSSGDFVTDDRNLLMGLYNHEGKFVKSFGERIKYDDDQLENLANQRIYEVYKDNILVAFLHHNKIEKYSSEGLLLLSIERDINYKIGYTIHHDVAEFEGRTSEYSYPVFNKVSTTKGIGVDYKGRIWVPTYIRQTEEGEDEKGDPPPEDLIAVEIYDPNGILLCRLPTGFYFYNFRIFGDRVYFVTHASQLYVQEYKIVEK